MLLTALVLFFLFRAAARASVRRAGEAPRGLQNFIEPFVTFIRDEVAKPSIGPKYEKYMPFLLSVFFFILRLNMIGQVLLAASLLLLALRVISWVSPGGWAAVPGDGPRVPIERATGTGCEAA